MSERNPLIREGEEEPTNSVGDAVDAAAQLARKILDERGILRPDSVILCIAVNIDDEPNSGLSAGTDTDPRQIYAALVETATAVGEAAAEELENG